MHASSEEIRVGIPSHRSRRWAWGIAAVLALAVLLAAAAAFNRPKPPPYVAEIRFAHWRTPRRLAIRFGLRRTDGQALRFGRAPEVVIVGMDGKPLPFVQEQTHYEDFSRDYRMQMIEASGVMADHLPRPALVRLRMVRYDAPPWWKQVLFRARPTEDEEQPPLILSGSEVSPAMADQAGPKSR